MNNDKGISELKSRMEKKTQYDQGSIGLKKNTCSGKFCLVLDKKEVWIS